MKTNSNLIKLILILTTVFQIQIINTNLTSSHLSDCDMFKNQFESYIHEKDTAIADMFENNNGLFCWNGNCVEAFRVAREFKSISETKVFKKVVIRECVKTSKSVKFYATLVMDYGKIELHNFVGIGNLNSQGKFTHCVLNSDYPDQWDKQVEEAMEYRKHHEL